MCWASQTSKNRSIPHKKGSFYFYWGYHRSTFSQSDIHFTGPQYDFTLYGVKASDRPSSFGTVYFNPAVFTVPQYNYRLGYFFTDRFAVSLGMDHMKYVMNAYQEVTISGVIKPAASLQYAGNYLNNSMKIQPDFLMFEHTNGFNLLSLDAEYLQPLFSLHQELFSLHWNIGTGAGILIPKTDVRVMGDGLDNRFHVAGYAMSFKTGPRIEYKHKIFLSAEYKAGYASLPDVLIKNDAPMRAEHNLFFYQYYVVAGIQFNLHLKKEKIIPAS